MIDRRTIRCVRRPPSTISRPPVLIRDIVRVVEVLNLRTKKFFNRTASYRAR